MSSPRDAHQHDTDSRGDRPGPSRQTQVGFAVLRVFFVGLLLVSAIVVSMYASWDSHLYIGRGVFYLDSGRAPLWDPPSPTSYTRFADTYKDVPSAPSAAPRLHVVLDYHDTMNRLALLLFFSCWFPAILYPIVGQGHTDWFLRAAVGGVIGMLAATALSIALGLVMGGWPAPFLAELALTGFVIGAVALPCFKSSPAA